MSQLSPTDDLTEVAARLRDFANARGWERYHTPKNLVMALSVEVAELVEPFQWLTAGEAGALLQDPQRLEEVESEIADVAIYVVRLADVLGVDLGDAIARKMAVNEARFPVGDTDRTSFGLTGR